MKIFSTLALSALSLVMASCTYAVRQSDKPRVEQIISLSEGAIADPVFRDTLYAISESGFDHSSDPPSHMHDDGNSILSRLFDHPVHEVVCRRASNPFNWKTKAWEGEGMPQLRCSELSKRSDSEWIGTIVHERAHAAGYRHKGNSRRGNECSVPHVLGDLVTFIAEKKTGSASLPTDACVVLQQVVGSEVIPVSK